MRWIPLSLNNGDLNLAFPSAWRQAHYRKSSSFTDLLVYLTNERLHAPCTDGSCGYPIDRLSPGGVLVSWSANGFPDWTLAHARGQVITVDGRPAKLLHDPGACSDIGADVSVVVDIPRPAATENFYELVACARQPGAGTAERLVNRMLATTMIKGV